MRKAAFPGALLFVWALLSSWGFLVHRTVNQLAVYELPKDLRVFFYVNMDYIVRHSVRPDLRRNEDSTEDKKHFIDFEAFGDSAAWKMPFAWNDALKLYTRDTLLEYGYVPYHIMAVKERLTNAFRNHIKDSILFYAADIAHYIGDAHVPLHTTLNYDGQLTNQKGLHSLWESFVPEIELDQFDLRSRHTANYLKYPERSVWNALRQAYDLTADVFLQEREVSKQFNDSTKYRIQIRRGKEVKSYSTEFARAYSNRLGKTINGQLLRSADLIADFWYTSWVDSGKPDIGTLLTSPVTDSQNKSLKLECKAFRKNKLVTGKLLIAKNNSGGATQ
ncbi:MAG TPA: zinc dependent phospholipase C family protein [Flavitalea sp.]|nr:zinc dependent phospholipase C family protein [Flavitalea sp.]